MESRATDRECLERQFLGEPDAGNPHVRFLEGGGFPPLLDWRFFMRGAGIAGVLQ